MGFRAAGGGGSGPAERWLDHQDNGRRPRKGKLFAQIFISVVEIYIIIIWFYI